MKGLTAQNCIWRPMARTLVVAAVSTMPAAAAAQQADSATPPAPSTTARPEPAKDSDSSFDANIGASLASDYNYRGYTLSDHQPSVSTNIEATYKHFFLGTNAASVQIPMLSQLQMTNYARIKISINGAGWKESDINRWVANPVAWRPRGEFDFND